MADLGMSRRVSSQCDISKGPVQGTQPRAPAKATPSAVEENDHCSPRGFSGDRRQQTVFATVSWRVSVRRTEFEISVMVFCSPGGL